MTSGFDFDQTSTDVSDLVASFVQEQVAPDAPLTIEALSNIQSGATDVTNIVSSVGDVSQVQNDIQTFVEENPALIDGSVSDLIEAIPAGIWDDTNWDDFNWG